MFKKTVSILLCALVIMCPLAQVYRAHAVALEASTIASYAVLGTALTACGILIASHVSGSDASVTEAIAAGWEKTTDQIKADIRSVALYSTVGGKLVAHWTAEKWNRFTKWVKETFNASGGNVLDIGAGSSVVLLSDSIMETSSYDLNTIPLLRRDITGKNGSPVSIEPIPLYSPTDASMGILQTAAGMAATILIGSSVLFQTAYASNNNFSWSYNTGYSPYYFYKPIIYGGTLVLPWCNKYVTKASSVPVWQFGADCGIASLVGRSLAYIPSMGGIFYSGGVVAGTWTSLAEYLKACIEAGVVIGIPLDSTGEVVPQGTSVAPQRESVDVDVNTDYYPDIGICAPPTDLPDGVGIDIPIPTTGEGVGIGDDVVTPADLTDADIIDLPYIGTMTPDEAMPRIKSDTTVGTTSAYMTTAKSLDIPSDVADETIHYNPDDEDSDPDDPEEEDSNDLKLPALLLTKFPFCIPYDFKNAIESLVADPAPPKFNFRLKVDALHLDHTFEVDLSSFDSVATIMRWLFSAFWVIILIRGTKRLLY